MTGAAGSTDDDREPGRVPLEIPDDASALDEDRQVWLAEQRAIRRRRRLRRLIFTRRWERFGLSGPIVVLCLLVTALFGGLAVAFVPRPRLPEPVAAPLAAAPEIRVTAASPSVAEPEGGEVLGRRLPPVALDGDVSTVSAADLRPAVVVLVPTACGCTEALEAVYRQVREFRLTLWLVGGAGSVLVNLDEDAAKGGARWAVDPSGALAEAVAARGTTLVVVRADGTVAGLRRDLPLDDAQLPALEPLLARLSTSNR